MCIEHNALHNLKDQQYLKLVLLLREKSNVKYVKILIALLDVITKYLLIAKQLQKLVNTCKKLQSRINFKIAFGIIYPYELNTAYHIAE